MPTPNFYSVEEILDAIKAWKTAVKSGVPRAITDLFLQGNMFSYEAISNTATTTTTTTSTTITTTTTVSVTHHKGSLHAYPAIFSGGVFCFVVIPAQYDNVHFKKHEEHIQVCLVVFGTPDRLKTKNNLPTISIPKREALERIELWKRDHVTWIKNTFNSEINFFRAFTIPAADTSIGVNDMYFALKQDSKSIMGVKADLIVEKETMDEYGDSAEPVPPFGNDPSGPLSKDAFYLLKAAK